MGFEEKVLGYLESIDGRLGAMEQRMDSLEQRVSAIEGDVAWLKEEMDDMRPIVVDTFHEIREQRVTMRRIQADLAYHENQYDLKIKTLFDGWSLVTDRSRELSAQITYAVEKVQDWEIEKKAVNL